MLWKHVIFAILVSLLALCPISLYADGNDTFTRSDSNTVGSTEAVNTYRWFEVNDNGNFDLITISDNTLLFCYTNSTPNNSNLACNVGGLNSDYIDISVSLTPYSTYYGQYYGVGYRLAAQNSKYQEAGGYYVRLDKSGGKVYLYYGSTAVTSADVTVPDGDSTLRVLADGTSHKVYFNSNLVIDTTHSGKTAAGYLGLFAYYSIVWADNCSVKTSANGPEISDNFDRANSNAPGTMKLAKFPWTEVNDNGNDNLISIYNNTLLSCYTISSPYNPNLACNLDKFDVANVDFEVKMTPYSDYYGQYYGVSYRLASTSSVYQDAGGYYVRLDKPGGKVYLYYGSTLVTSADVAIPSGDSLVRVVAEGSNHKVWLNGTKVIDVNDSSKTTAGKVGLFTYYSIVTFDDFFLLPFPSPWPVGDDFILALYGMDAADYYNKERKFGWNMAHSYAPNSNLTTWCENSGYRSWPNLPSTYGTTPNEHFPTSSEAGNEVGTWTTYPSTGWWYLPEELAHYKGHGQHLDFSDGVTGGHYHLTVVNKTGGGSSTTGELAYNISNDSLQTQVESLISTAGYSGVTVSVSYGPSPADLELRLSGTDKYLVPMMTADVTALTGGTPALAITQIGSYDLFTSWCYWARAYAPRALPRIMYIASNYLDTDYANYVSYMDIIPSSCYTTYAHQPHAWVRWRIEETINAITDPNLGNTSIGKDYLNGERTPIGICELFYQNPDRVMTPEGAYHDFWECIVSGARGISIYSYIRMYDAGGQPNFLWNWDMYCKAASEISGPEKLGQVILNGTVNTGVGCTVTSGPSETDSFDPGDGTIQYPSIHVLAKTYNGKTYVIAVNSQTSTVGANITGLPTGVSSAEVLFEGRTVSINSGTLSDSWAGLGVHIYKINGT